MPFNSHFSDDEPDEISDLPLLKRIVNYPKRLYGQFLAQMIFGRSQFWRLMYKCYFSNPVYKLMQKRRERKRRLQSCMYQIEECYHDYLRYIFSQMPRPSPGKLLKKRRVIEPPKALQKHKLNRKLSDKDVSDDEIDEMLDFTMDLSTLLEEHLNSINENDKKFELYYNDTAKSLYKFFTVINN